MVGRKPRESGGIARYVDELNESNPFKVQV